MTALRVPLRSKKQSLKNRRTFFVTFLVVFAGGSTFWLLHVGQLHISNSNNNGVVDAIQAFPHPQISNGLKRENAGAVVQERKSESNKHHHRAQVWMAGIIRNASIEIQPQVLEYMVILNCQHDISIHIVASMGVDECLDAYKDLVKQHEYDASNCAEFIVQQEPLEYTYTNKTSTTGKKNRIDQIATVRDYQRELLRTKYGDTIHWSDSIVILVDLDLHRLPSMDTLLQELHCMQTIESEFDIVCAAGIMYRPFGYYDIFATVMLDGTFVYPIRGRLEQKLQDGENYSLVRSNDVYGNFTQWDLLEYFETESARRNGNAVPVRSCFGGLTLYRASVWFQESCQYAVDNPKSNTTAHLQRYATKASERPCEHVVLHECLLDSKSNTNDVRIGVQPGLKTEWNSDAVFENKLYPGTRHESLGVYKKHAEQGDALTNGDYRLRINEQGALIVERFHKMKENDSSVVMWSATPTIETEIENWTHSFLMLRPRGVLELIRQVSMSEMKERQHYDEICSVKNGTAVRTCDCDVKSNHCKVTVWSNEGETVKLKEKSDGNRSYALVLDAKGMLAVVDETSNQTVWSSKKKNRKVKKKKERKTATKE
jgi:hypothetical protein